VCDQQKIDVCRSDVWWRMLNSCRENLGHESAEDRDRRRIVAEPMQQSHERRFSSFSSFG
jgi:hypothetical protein